jgi:tetratricopeptide (TPR) repeat protein
VLTLEVPKDKYVQVWSPNHKPAISEHDGVRTYHWEVAQCIPAPKPTPNGQGDDTAKATAPKDPDEDADGRKLPSVAWTTFHSWAEVGDWYRTLALSRAQPNDALHARAAEITKDAKTPEDQVRAIYSFVSTRTRYVGIDFGVGRYQPHFAAEVLANQYGDCKDKDTLLEALLAAQGFRTAPALIGVGTTPVPDVPSPAVFNHVITTVDLPGGRIWLDSTPEVAPYRLLSAAIRDQLALVVPAAAPAALERTPAAPPYPLIARFDSVGALDAEGKLTTHVTASYRTDDEIFVRALARSVAPAEQDKVSQYVSSVTGFSGTTSNTAVTNLDDLSAPIVLTYDYSRHPYGDWPFLRIVPAFPALEFGGLVSDSSPPPEDIQLGAPRTLIASCRIRLPDGYRTDLPDAIHVKTDFATFDKTYRFDGKEILVERNITVLKNKLPKTEWKRYQAFTKDIGLESEPWIQLIKPPAPITVTGPSGSTSKTVPVQGLPLDATHAKPAEPAPPSSASAIEWMQAAGQDVMSRDWASATAKLDKAKAINPAEFRLWAMYGYIALAQRKYEEAETDFRKELAAHPENTDAISVLAETQNLRGDSAGARHTIQGYLDAHPGDLKFTLHLAALQHAAEDYPGEVKTLETAAAQNPDDRSVRARLTYALLRVDRNEEAAAVAKTVAADTDDPNMLNQAAYALAEAGLDLPYAEEVSRKSISLLEGKSAAITTAEVNSKAFADSNLLIAS